MSEIEFQSRTSVEQVEESTDFAPKFDSHGLIPCITTDAQSGEVLMLGWMNDEALKLTIETGEAHYFSRARQVREDRRRNDGELPSARSGSHLSYSCADGSRVEYAARPGRQTG